jgi:hypothetical protein
MGGRLTLAALFSSVAFGCIPAFAQVTDKAREAARIESECGLKKGTITVSGDEVRLQPSPDEAYDHVDCALTRLNKAGLGKLGFVGNEADPNAVLEIPLRYVAEGSSAQIAALVKAAQADKWTVVRTATASDGMVIVQFESSSTMTHGQATLLLNRIWKNEFGDIFLGLAPHRLSARNPDDD